MGTKFDGRPVMNRRSFVRAAALAGAGVLPAGAMAGGRQLGDEGLLSGGISHGDAAILRFLAAAEILETDAWQQYNELASGNPDYQAALKAVDDDMPDYVEQNTNDEVSHAQFLNAFLRSVGRRAVNLDA